MQAGCVDCFPVGRGGVLSLPLLAFRGLALAAFARKLLVIGLLACLPALGFGLTLADFLKVALVPVHW